MGDERRITATPRLNGIDRRFVWGILAVIILPALVFLTAYLESSVTGTSYAEHFFSWMGLHDDVLRFIHRISV
jgi:hypothetical protein